jgi:hypothetical protein
MMSIRCDWPRDDGARDIRRPDVVSLAMAGLSLALFTLPFLGGCGGSSPVRVPISGTVTLDQRPIGPVSVVFVPTARQQVGCVVQSMDGQFDLPADLGPSPGQFQVTVEPLEPDLEEYERRRLAGRSPLNQAPIPAKYRKRGELTVTIEPGGQRDVVIALRSDS